MSFDMTIRYNRACSRSVALEPLSKFIGSFPDVQTVRTSLLVYEVPPDRRMEICLGGAYPNSVDCIALHIPYAYLEERSAEMAYYQLAFKIASLLGWKLYDHQTGKYVRIRPRAYAEQKAFDRLVLGASRPYAARVTVGLRGKSLRGKPQSNSEKQPLTTRGKKKTSARNRTTVIFNFLTAKDITSPKYAGAFFDLMTKWVSGSMPTRCGLTEPLRVRFAEAKGIAYQQWAQDLTWEDPKNGVWGMVFHHKNRHTTAKHIFRVDDLAPGSCVEFLKEASALFQVDFSCAHVYGKEEPEREDAKLQGIVSLDLQASLPSVPWIACFGPPYQKMFGKKKLMAAPFAGVARLANDLIFCQLVDDPSQCIERPREYRAKRAKIKAVLGMQYFFDPAHPEKKAVVPKFYFLKKPRVWREKPGWGLMSLAELRLSVGATRCLEAEGITAVHHLVVRTEEELLKIRNFGEARLREVKEKLQECGLRLGMT